MKFPMVLQSTKRASVDSEPASVTAHQSSKASATLTMSREFQSIFSDCSNPMIEKGANDK